MKRGLLLLLGMFVMVSTVEAKEGINPTERIGVNNRYNEAVSFIERGIQFQVFLNGEFDFDSRYIRERRNSRVRISRDYKGRINRVGNVFINYDYKGNVRKIGTIYMSYNRGRLTRVGNLRVNYNSWGDPQFYGQIRYNDYYYNRANYYNQGLSLDFNINLGAICVYNDPYFYRNEFRTNYRQIREDDNFYYYRANKNAKTSRNKILKRRKPARRAVTQSNGVRKRVETNTRAQNKRRDYTTSTQVKKRTPVKRRVSNNKRTQVKKEVQVKKRVQTKKRVYKKNVESKKRTQAKKRRRS